MERGLRVVAVGTCLGGILAVLGPVSAHAAELEQFAGSDRYSTAARFAYATAEEEATAPTAVVIANGEGSGVDALSASYLAGRLGAPILLTTAGHVPEVTTRAVEALDPDTVYVVGGEPSVHTDSLAALTRDRDLVRVSGADRYATSVAVWDAARAAGAPAPTEVFLARGDQPAGQVAADALAAGPAAYARGIPILLTGQYVLPDVVRQRLAATSGLTRATMLGGVQTVGIPVAEAVLDATENVLLQRIAGANRSDTAAQLTRAYGPTSPSAVTLASGYTVDALGAAAYAGATGQGILLALGASDLGSGTGAYLAAHDATLTDVTVAGGATSVSEESLQEITRYATKVSRSYQDPVEQPIPWRGETLDLTVVQADPVEPRWYFRGWNYPIGVAAVSDRDRFPDDGSFTVFLSRLSGGEVVSVSRNPDGTSTFAAPFTLTDQRAVVAEVDLVQGHAVLSLDDGREVYLPVRADDSYVVAGRAVDAATFYGGGSGQITVTSFDSRAAVRTVLTR